MLEPAVMHLATTERPTSSEAREAPVELPTVRQVERVLDDAETFHHRDRDQRSREGAGARCCTSSFTIIVHGAAQPDGGAGLCP